MIRHGRNLIVLFLLVFAAVFSLGDQRSSGQQQLPPTNRKPACTIFCGGPNPNYFWLFTREQYQAGQCYGGPLPTDQATNFYNELSEEQRKAICQNLKSADKRTTECPSFKELASLCNQNEPPKKECERATPWFGNSSPCTDVQAWIAEMDGRTVTLSICGAPVFRHVVEPPADVNTYSSNMLARVIASAGTTVCCDKFWEAARTGKPCDPRADVDCDGRLNEKDSLPEVLPPKPNSDPLAPPEYGAPYPTIGRPFSKAEDAPIDPFPPGLNSDDTEFFPPQDKCDCKWELVKGTLTCSAGGSQRHVYQARWRCPSTGNERFTRKEAPASAPCSQPQRSGY